MAGSDHSLLTDELSELILSDQSLSIAAGSNHKQISRSQQQHRHHHRQEWPAEKLRLPSKFNSIVGRIERRFKNSEDWSSCVIDLKELAVVGNTVPTKRYTAIVPPLEQDSSDWAAQPYSNMIESYKPGKAARSSSTYVPTTFTQQVAAFGRDSGIGIGRGTTGGLVRYEPPSFSLIHVMEYQMEMLQTLRKQLMESEALDLRRELETKILTVLGLPAIPSPESSTIMPFVTFDEGGKFHITFLYDDPPFTFWSTILRQHFGIQYMSLQKEVYSLINRVPIVRSMRRPTGANNVVMSQGMEMEFSESSDEDFDAELLQPMRRSTPLIPMSEVPLVTPATNKKKRVSTGRKSGKGKAGAVTKSKPLAKDPVPKKRSASLPGPPAPSAETQSPGKKVTKTIRKRTTITVVPDQVAGAPFGENGTASQKGGWVDQLLRMKQEKQQQVFSTPIVSKSAAASNPSAGSSRPTNEDTGPATDQKMEFSESSDEDFDDELLQPMRRSTALISMSQASLGTPATNMKKRVSTGRKSGKGKAGTVTKSNPAVKDRVPKKRSAGLPAPPAPAAETQSAGKSAAASNPSGGASRPTNVDTTPATDPVVTKKRGRPAKRSILPPDADQQAIVPVRKSPRLRK